MTDLTTTNNGRDPEAVDRLRDEAMTFAQNMIDMREERDQWKTRAERLGADLQIANVRLEESERREREATFKAERYLRAVVAMDTRAAVLEENARALAVMADELRREARDAARMSAAVEERNDRETEINVRAIAQKFSPRIGGMIPGGAGEGSGG